MMEFLSRCRLIMVDKKTRITFEKESNTEIKVFHDGLHVGNIWSQSEKGKTPYPHTDDIKCLESIQICGFASTSAVWSCGVFNGTKDMTVRFNPMTDEYYQKYYEEYKEYVNTCLKNEVPQMIKSFNDWVGHLGYPTAGDVRRTL